MAKPIKTVEPSGIKLTGIELLSSSLSRPELAGTDNGVFLFNVRVIHDIDGDKKLVFIIVHVDIDSIVDKKNVGSIAVSLIFNIDNFEEVVTILDDKNFTLTEALKDVLNSIAISTTRGVMFATFKGTYLHNALLPVVDAKQLAIAKQ